MISLHRCDFGWKCYREYSFIFYHHFVGCLPRLSRQFKCWPTDRHQITERSNRGFLSKKKWQMGAMEWQRRVKILKMGLCHPRSFQRQVIDIQWSVINLNSLPRWVRNREFMRLGFACSVGESLEIIDPDYACNQNWQCRAATERRNWAFIIISFFFSFFERIMAENSIRTQLTWMACIN